ncbi:poly(A) RNA polymerase gld-2 homolog A-like isoform X2 [Lineus longissimus]|uniref:poly(A) RNA polymerase gld-2 homolog A-like isoform X2 n=1 Tax=Lineus longissimus TaxID=88925 RepID=UPI002B4DEEE1
MFLPLDVKKVEVFKLMPTSMPCRQVTCYPQNGHIIRRQYDEYYEQWDDPSPAKRSRGDEGNHVPNSRPNRNNLLAVNVTRDHYQNRDVKKTHPVEDVRVPPPHVAAHPDQKITNHIWQHFLDKQQTQEAYQKKMRLREALYTVTKGIFPYCGLYMVGSSMSGFGSVYSDLDMCLMLSHKAIDQKKEATDILALLLKSLKKCTFIKQMELIRARVPILKFRDKIANVECDLNVNNSVGIRNTHLLGAYSRMDWRVRPLVLFTKHWAQFHDINDARKMTISSYSLSMMVLHYLQCGCNPPVLPSLHKLEPDKYSFERDVRTLSLAETLPEFQTKNKETLAELFLGFLEYYACKFDFENDVISIRLGTKVPKRIIARQSFQGPAAQWKFLCIEEPFDLSNTSRSVYDQYTFMRILQVFKVSHRRLHSTRNIMSLFDHPF